MNSIQQVLHQHRNDGGEISELGKDPKWNEIKAMYRDALREPELLNRAEKDSLRTLIQQGRLPKSALLALCRNLKELRLSWDAMRDDI
jgi:hypothetical protein